jgi:hypothetical protein
MAARYRLRIPPPLLEHVTRYRVCLCSGAQQLLDSQVNGGRGELCEDRKSRIARKQRHLQNRDPKVKPIVLAYSSLISTAVRSLISFN